MLYILRVAFASLLVLVAGPGRARAGDYTFHRENVMGTSLELQARAVDAPAARRAEARALREIERLSAIFSGYDPASEFSRWQRGPKGPVRVSQELFDVLQASDWWFAESGGAFDPRVEALSRLWASCAEEGRAPTEAEAARAQALMAPPAWRLGPDGRTAERLSDCPVSLNAIAKGHIVERAAAAAIGPRDEIQGIMLNIGGDLIVKGSVEGAIGIATPWADSESSPPLNTIVVRDRSVATSGSSQRGFSINGRWHSHIFDPREAAPAARVLTATVVARRSSDADALATVCNVLAPEESLRLARSLPDVECMIVASDRRVWRSEGWRRYEEHADADERASGAELALADDAKNADDDAGPSDRPSKSEPKTGGQSKTTDKAGAKNGAQSKAKTGAPWDPRFELVARFEINRPSDAAGQYRRPYLAVWVEDEKGRTVRTLALWVSFTGAGPFQWLPDLKRWHAADRERKRRDKKELLFTVARPTRPPGKYSVIWNGKDDAGKALPAGEYTVSIEAAREHGTYQVIRKKVVISDQPFHEELKGNVEIRSASIEYRRKPQTR